MPDFLYRLRSACVSLTPSPDFGDTLAEAVRNYHLPDFSNWKNPAAFARTFTRCLKAVCAGRGNSLAGGGFSDIFAGMVEEASGKNLSLEEIAMLAMEFGRLLMECGASAQIVDEYVVRVARAAGAERVDLRIGYASLAITVGIGGEGITRMRKVGALGVNQRLDQALRQLGRQLEAEEIPAAAARAELERLVRQTPRHPGWFVDLAVGLACAAFGRLLGVDWLAFGPIFCAAAIGQFCRRQLLLRNVNVFITATLVAFLASVLSGLGARGTGSSTVDTAMTAAVLLLVPGVPSLNAQYDILDGRPTLGSARAVWVVVILIFLTAGVWLGQMALGEGR
jgi:uncharacterized membrane protein YjjP (DUF1212 family)